MDMSTSAKGQAADGVDAQPAPTEYTDDRCDDWQNSSDAFQAFDRVLHGLEGKITGGISPIAIAMAGFDWAAHMANAPFHRAELAIDAWMCGLRMMAALAGVNEIEPAADDHRFVSEGWAKEPYRGFMQWFLLAQGWTEEATSCLSGVSCENGRIARFVARQGLDMFSPSNIPWANPEVIATTLAEGGRNLFEGAVNALTDMSALATGSPPLTRFKPGRNVAVARGKVVFRNELIELLQYASTTGTVRAEPVLITPAWIMKYYIMDLSPHNSLIHFLVAQGFTVFCISWRNPGVDMRETSFDAYRSDGFLAALDAVGHICGDVRVHACGYCLGGTLLAITAAAMARDGDKRLASVSLFAAQTDFSEAGELQLFINEPQIAFLEDAMADRGYLDGKQMGGAFQLLRSRDLIWSRMVKNYWLGRGDEPNDLMAWNDDATRLPARMHSEYLRRLFLHNDLAEGRYLVDDRPIALSDIQVPLFVVGTAADHVAPWCSVFKIHLLNPGEITFVLTSGGHNAGIVSEPGHPQRHFRIATRMPGTPYVGPESWFECISPQEGSWWPVWTNWLAARSREEEIAPPSIGNAAAGLPAIDDAPGSYVLER
ncbi:MAG: alpha/beta fold hydrolase [Candidatus Sphingomonas colombiensis]|nr:alpha/beta fold hydrolase [Sphingomonas sp.]WEK43233.1 MAG: alpha/beta fold hydrolase [Sphingomonas sp.]